MIIIPARLQSTRLAQKLLLPLGGIPIIVRTARVAMEVGDCVVACDDERILEACKAHKVEAIMTAKTHNSGTDRCAEAARILGLGSDEIIINLQGDEPFMESQVVRNLHNAMKNAKDAFMASCYKPITPQAAEDANLVKVVIDAESYALYFSRAKIPYNRANAEIPYLGHLGIYAFYKKTLDEFCALGASTLENIEKLEQLRALENGKKILMIPVESAGIGIDTIEDYNAAVKIIEKGEK